MISHKITKNLTGLIALPMFAAVSQAEVTLSDFLNLNLTGTYVAWDTGTFTSGAKTFTVQANANGGGFKGLVSRINASGNDTISIRMDVNHGNFADKFNIVLFDGDGTARVYRFDGITVGRTYQFKTSGNLVDWPNFGSSVVGKGDICSVADPISAPGVKFYQVGETP